MKYLLTILLLLSPKILLAAPGKNSFKLNDSVNGDFLKKNILKGNWEVGGTGKISYSSFSGLTRTVNVTGRYFFYDHVSLGLKAGKSVSQLHKSYVLGPSVNWYFLELSRWAFNLGQDVYHYNSKFSFGPEYLGTTHDWRGTTKIGANYFLNSSVSIGLSLEYDYTLTGKTISDDYDGLTSSVGFNVAF